MLAALKEFECSALDWDKAVRRGSFSLAYTELRRVSFSVGSTELPVYQ